MNRNIPRRRKHQGMSPAIWALLLLCNYALAQASTALSDLANSMQPGTWAELTTNNLNAAFDSGANGSSGVVDIKSEVLKWDPVGHRLYFIGGDASSNSTTATMKHLQYDEATNAWSVLPQQSWFTKPTAHSFDQ